MKKMYNRIITTPVILDFSNTESLGFMLSYSVIRTAYSNLLYTYINSNLN